MTIPDDPRNLNTGDWDQLQDWVERYEATWQAGETARLDPHVPPAGHPLRAPILVELVKIDLSNRWKRQLPTYVEAYLGRFPELAAAPAVVASLLAEEFRARQINGNPVALAEYQARFPDHARAVEQLVHQQSATDKYGTIQPPPRSAGSSTVPTPAAVQVLPVGGGYRLLKEIGRGKVGEVWQAEAPGGSRSPSRSSTGRWTGTRRGASWTRSNSSRTCTTRSWSRSRRTGSSRTGCTSSWNWRT